MKKLTVGKASSHDGENVACAMSVIVKVIL